MNTSSTAVNNSEEAQTLMFQSSNEQEAISTTGEQPVEAPALELVERHFWAGVWGTVRPVLHVDRYASSGDEPLVAPKLVPLFLRFFDSKGEVFSSSTIQVEVGQRIELTPFFESCVRESGILHCHLEVLASSDLEVRLLHLADRGLQIQSGLHMLNRRILKAFPFRIDAVQGSFLCVASTGEQPSKARLKLLLGKRSSEAPLVVPAFASRLVSLDVFFPDVDWEAVAAEQSHVSVRLSLKEGAPLAISTVELHRTPAGNDYLTGIS